jgi:hypothetical protein
MNLLKEYLKEYLYFKKRPEYDLENISSFFKRFFSSSREASDDWLDSQAEKYNVDFSDNFREKVRKYAASNYETVQELSDGSKRSSREILFKILDKKYGNYIRKSSET